MFRRVLCSLSLAASIVIVSSASSYGQTPNFRPVKEALDNNPEVKKAGQNAWKKSGQFIESVGKGVGTAVGGTGLYCYGTRQAAPCPRSDSSDNEANSQPNNTRYPNPSRGRQRN
ncbi:MAG: hypothetical protein AN488_17060 [Anabaena sp. WA113]|nr:MAG: hypothetical protein AN488_17060 [Anabaena sp. WA113]